MKLPDVHISLTGLPVEGGLQGGAGPVAGMGVAGHQRHVVHGLDAAPVQLGHREREAFGPGDQVVLQNRKAPSPGFVKKR